MITPIKPSEVTNYKKSIFPDAVIEAFNELIAKNWNDGIASFKRDTVSDLISNKLLGTGIKYDSIFLNIEDIYQAEGWKVEYESAGYNESYFDPSFRFSIK